MIERIIRDVTIDDIINYLIEKHNIVIYDKIEPYVDPCSKGKICYNFAIKRCSFRDGWNGRVYIGETGLYNNRTEAIEKAISIAFQYITSSKQ